jgi:hypothetical protein
MSEKESLIQGGQVETQKRETQIHDPIEVAVNLLFETFRMIYPSWMRGKWDDEVDFAKDIWVGHFRRFHSDESPEKKAKLIAQAVDQAIDRFPTHPPTLGEFKQILAVRPEHQRVQLEVIEPSKNPEVARSAMDALKDLVGKKKL